MTYFTRSGGSPPRKNPVKRAFTGLAGSPLSAPAVEETSVAVIPEELPTVEAVPRRGRPAKYGVAMSRAEQQRRKREEKARRNLIAKLLRIYRRMQATPYARSSKGDTAFVAACEQIRRQQRRYFEELNELPLPELRRLLDVWTETPDSHGRLHGETSGGYGEGKITEVAEAERAAEDGTRTVKPEGHDPKKVEGGIKASTSLNKHCEESTTKQRRLERKMELVARRMTENGVCSVCGVEAGEEHIWQRWYESTAAEAKFLSMHRAGAPYELRAALYELIDHEHLKKIGKMLKKNWVSLGGSANDASDGECTTVLAKLLNAGWVFFSTLTDRTEMLLPPWAIFHSFYESQQAVV